MPRPALSFSPGQTTRTVTVVVNADVLDESDETFNVNLSGAAGATIGDGIGVGTITDDDPLPALTINDVTVTEGDTGTVAATFTIGLSAVSGRTVTVDYATANGSAVAPGDYVARSGVLTFLAGQTTQQLTVTVNGDTLDEFSETYSLNLTDPVSATIADGSGVGTIIDDDSLPSLSVNDVTVTEGQSGTVNANFTVSLSAASGQTVSVGYATADGTATAGADYVATGGSLVFSPGTTTRTLTVQTTSDTLDEIDETFFANLSDPVNATIADGQGIGTITDDDNAPSITIGDVSVAEGNSGTANAIFTATLSAASGRTDHGRLRDGERHGASAGRLRGRGAVDGDVQPGPGLADDHRPGERRRPRRDQRDVLREPLERFERDDCRPAGARHDQRRRRVPDACRSATRWWSRAIRAPRPPASPSR